MSAKKIFVVSDIHGHFSLLKKALVDVGFDPENKQHLLISCGDHFDRGSENAEVLKFFERLKNCVLLRGNHEDLLLELFETGKLKQHNLINGTFETLRNFFGKYFVNPLDNTIDFSGHNRTVDRLCEFINGTIDYYETKNYVFVHGWLPERCKTESELSDAPKEDWAKARWVKWTEKYDGVRPLPNKTLICGHMPTFYADQFDGRENDNSDIFYGNGIIAIDAGTFDSKNINVLVIEDELL